MNKYLAPAILTTSLFLAPQCAAEIPAALPVPHEPKHEETHSNPGGSSTPDIYVEWDGTVLEATPDPARGNYIILHPIGKIASQALKGFIDWEKGFYPGEALENGAIIFQHGDIEPCDARVTREGGRGSSFPSTMNGTVPGKYCQEIGNLALPR